MRHRPWRVLAAVVGILGGGLVMHAVEQARSVEAPSGWIRTAGTALGLAGGVPRIGTSVWRLGDGAVFQTEASVQQLFLRARFAPGSALIVSLDSQTLVRLGEHGAESVQRPPDAPACMGDITVPQSGTIGLELSRAKNGLVLRSANARSICAAPGDGVATIAVQGKVDLLSIGRDKRPDGVPLSQLEWLAGIMIFGFLWMLSIDLALAWGLSFPLMAIAWTPIIGAWFIIDSGWGPKTVAVAAIGASLGLTAFMGLIAHRGASKAEE